MIQKLFLSIGNYGNLILDMALSIFLNQFSVNFRTPYALFLTTTLEWRYTVILQLFCDRLLLKLSTITNKMKHVTLIL